MTRIPKKVSVGVSLTEEDKVKLDILKERSFIKSISEGIRRATNEWLQKSEVIMKLNEDMKQTRIPDYGE